MKTLFLIDKYELLKKIEEYFTCEEALKIKKIVDGIITYAIPIREESGNE